MKKIKVLTNLQSKMVIGGDGTCTCYYVNGIFKELGVKLNKDTCLKDCCSNQGANRVIFQGGFGGWEIGRCSSSRKLSVYLEEKKQPYKGLYSNKKFF